MENKKNDCGCGDNKLTNNGSDESLPASPQPVEIRAGKRTMTRVGNEIRIGEGAFPELRTSPHKAAPSELTRHWAAQNEHNPLVQLDDPERPRYARRFPLDQESFKNQFRSNNVVFLTDFDVPLCGAGLSLSLTLQVPRFLGMFQVPPEPQEKPLKGPGDKPWPQGITRIGSEPKDSAFKDYDTFYEWLLEQKKKDENKQKG